LRGPLPPALAANSLRAFSSAECQSTLHRFDRAWTSLSGQVTGGESYQPSSSQGKPSRRRQDPCSASSGPLRAWPCRLEISSVSSHGGAVWRGCKQQSNRERNKLTFSVSATHFECIDIITAENARRSLQRISNREVESLACERQVADCQPQKKKASKSQPEKLGGETVAGILDYLITLG
jgi:hypothetical protein